MISSPLVSSSFDPALHLHSEFDQQGALPSICHSELEALYECIEETKAANARQRIVIQHRAWNTAEVFRSEVDHSIDSDTPSKDLGSSNLKRFKSDSFIHGGNIPSSPPLITMPMISSPVTYPPSSSPQLTSPKKRKRPDNSRSPLKTVHANQPPKRVIGGFLDDSDDEEEVAALQQASLKRRRAIDSVRDEAAHTDHIVDHTPPASQDDTDMNIGSVPVVGLSNELTPPYPGIPFLQAHGEATTRPTRGLTARMDSGKGFYIPRKISKATVPYEQLIAARSIIEPGRAQQSYYGINIHQMMEDMAREDEEKARNVKKTEENTPRESVEQPMPTGKRNHTLMWTEKYRAKRFTDLVGDERTHRSVLRWLKGWDPIVFPGSNKAKAKPAYKAAEENEEPRHRKILLLNGPPGLGKTTLAHVCAKQAGYEVQEINASDERSSHVVKGRIRDMVGTENVRGSHATTATGKVRKAGKPVCVVVDEVDGVVGGSGGGGGGEGGFIKALIDLVNLDEKNSRFTGPQNPTAPKKRGKGDKFRLLRPLILICNDVYHPSLRPLRQSTVAEIIHIRKPPLNMVISRMHSIFEMEGIPCDTDGVRRLCEATWGVSTKKEGGAGSGTGEGDIRGVMVVGEWVAGKLRATMASPSSQRLTRKWIEDSILNDLTHGGGAARSLGRGGAKDVVERIFKEGAGFPRTAGTSSTSATQVKHGVIGVAEGSKRRAMERLREMIDASGDSDRIITDCFTSYPAKPFQDDTLMSKPCAAYDWLHFHDSLSSAVHSSQEWELFPYLSQSALAFHDLFASPKNLQNSAEPTDPDEPPAPYSGPSAPYTASEHLKQNRAQLMALHSSLSIPLTRIFRSPEELATELLPYVLRMLSPDVKPVIVNTGPSGSRSAATASVRKASEKLLVNKAVEAMAATGVRFERSRVEMDDAANRNGGWVFRMEPPLDQLGKFETLGGKKEEKVRYAVRQVLESQWKHESAKMDAEARRRRGGQGADGAEDEDKGQNEAKLSKEKDKVKRDFFGRVLKVTPVVSGEVSKTKEAEKGRQDEGRIWVSFHEGFSNAVRKPITIDELMRGL
ncbi:P-loop containing nucleoside triphosphate hydrolase protein [Delitschia confertaspora ATCC 74209]|uniref:P-loop containing nucleoside triphosphate hydrolase protein n=1 Tax=Delitschia confertaspora ATCC 74209 TaxID=1513339 RepID=A0A9P4MTL5_9PLEO|nr:P-loop containing nucleoside triphosphate hydrolase protein [Delitschia confertaspora ATCC 74209]